MKQVVILILTLSCSSQTFSQIHYISLHDKPLDVYNRNFHVAEVIDARSNKSSIGWVQRGINNKRVIANFKAGLAIELQTYLQQQLPALGNSRPVIIKVIKCSISEKTTMASESSKAEVVLDFVHQQDTAYYHIYRAAVVVERGGLDVTGQHEKNLAKALQDCLQEFAAINIDEKIRISSSFTRQEITQSFDITRDVLDYPVLTTDALKKGVYANFLEFRNNAPGITKAVEIKDNTKSGLRTREVIPYYVEVNGGRKPVKDVWGFSDGEIIYIRHDKDYFPMEREGSLFTFFGYAPLDQNAVTTGAVIGGLVGGAVAAAVTNKSKDELYYVDVITGKVSVSETFVSKQAARAAVEHPAKVIVYCRSKAERGKEAQIFLNDSLVAMLQPQAYVELEWSDPLAEMVICGETKEKGCFTFVPSFKKTNYIECEIQSKENPLAPELAAVEEKAGEFYVKRIIYFQEKQKKSSGSK